MGLVLIYWFRLFAICHYVYYLTLNNDTLMQLIGVTFVLGWTSCIFTPFCLILKYLDLLRIDPLEEEVGMDMSRHKGSAYESGPASESSMKELNLSRSGTHLGKSKSITDKSIKTVDVPDSEKPSKVAEPEDQ